MIPQTYPLYTTILGEEFLVVGWTDGMVCPVLAPLTTAELIRVYRGSNLIFRTERERSRPAPSEAVTEKIQVPFPRIEGIR